jgi:HEPN domain-containing protein
MKGNDYLLKEKAKQWFAKGDNDIKAVKILAGDSHVPTDTACFHCQQAVEKYLKGYLTLKNIDFLKSHDLDYLLKLCKDVNSKFETIRESALTLNKYGIEPRYPADIPIYYSAEEMKAAMEMAEEAVNFVREQLGIE